MSDIFDDLKRLSIFGKLFVALSNNKIVLKDLDKPDEHHTIKFTQDGFIDLHYTKEGSEKKYESQAKVNLMEAVKGIIENPSIIEDAMHELIKNLKKVTFDEEEFSQYVIAPMMTTENVAQFAKKTKRKVEIPSEHVDEFQFNKIMIPWKSAKGKIHGNALVFDKDNPVGFIYEKDEQFLYFPISLMENSSIAKFIKTFSMHDEIDAQKKNNPI